MSHTTELPDGWTAIHNSDLSGETIFKLYVLGEVIAEVRIDISQLVKIP